MSNALIMAQLTHLCHSFAHIYSPQSTFPMALAFSMVDYGCSKSGFFMFIPTYIALHCSFNVTIDSSFFALNVAQVGSTTCPIFILKHDTALLISIKQMILSDSLNIWFFDLWYPCLPTKSVSTVPH